MAKSVVSLLGIARFFGVDDASSELSTKERQSEVKATIIQNELDTAKALIELSNLDSVKLDAGVKVHEKIQTLKFD